MHLRKRATQIPAPVVVPTSGKFEGNDGKWSTFFINLNSDQKGVHGQDFRVLASTSSSITLVPGRTEWCDEKCAARRGLLLFDGSQPRGMVPDQGTWSQAGLYEIPVPEWFSPDLRTSGNLTLRGNWGTTQIGLGQSDPNSLVLPGSYAVSYLFDSYFLGSFGLAYGVVGGPGATKSTFLTRFREANQITSVSYGYTAGAWYRNNNNGAPGSLVLGGYDQSRMTSSALSLRMPNTQNTTLIVGVPSIVYSPDPDVAADPSSFTATADCGGFSANVDSTLPYLILPDCICDQFQETYGLTYDTTQNLYFVNASSHDTNKQQNGTVEFKIAAGPSDSGTYTIIKLGYPAFDHQISSVTGENGKNYFPIKKSKNGVFTLGRTFLQEAYIIVDYERSNFTVAPALYTDSLNKQDLRPIYNTTFDPTTSSASSGGGLGTGAIAGTVVGIVVAFAIAGVLAFCWWRKRKNNKQAEPLPHETSQIDPTLAGDQVKARRISELTGSDLPSSPKSPVGDYYSADHKNFPPISEMSPDSPPVELYSPPADSASDVDGRDYFTAGKTPHRRGAQRDRASSGYTTPGTPIAELPGDEGQYVVSPMTSPQPSRGPSDTSLNTNIDQRLADHKKDTERTSADAAAADDTVGPKDETQAEVTTETEKERRPSHTRGLSDTTIASESTAVSQPTPEEEERWAREPALEPRRPLSE